MRRWWGEEEACTCVSVRCLDDEMRVQVVVTKRNECQQRE
jgi:hypothetical protein